MENFPTLNTQRLNLRKIEVADVPSLIKHVNNPKISQFVTNIPYPYQETDAVFRLRFVHQGFKDKMRYVFAIVSKEHGELIGEIGLHSFGQKGVMQMGYWVGEPFWNQGIASEAIAAVVKFGFEKLALDLVYATCHLENPASAKVLTKNGFVERSVEGGIARFDLTLEQFTSR